MPIRSDSHRAEASGYEPRKVDLHCAIRREHIDLALIVDSLTARFKTAHPSAIRQAIAELIAEADNFTDCEKNWTDNTPMARQREDLAPLEAAADKLGGLLFPDGEAARFLTRLSKSGADMVVVHTLDDGVLTFPWNLVRLPGGGGWLGEQACFRMVRDGEGGQLNLALKRDETGVVAGYADDDSLLSGRPSRTLPEATRAELDSLERFTDADVQLLDDLPPGELDGRNLAKMQEWLSRPLHLFHFNCHASDPGDPEGFTEIGLRMGARVSGRQVLGGLAMTGAVVLDVCSAAQGKEHWWDNCFAACLHRRGVPAVCASSSTVSDSFGTRFAEELYKQVPLHDYQLLGAMRSAQRVLLAETGHPMALYYTFEGSGSYEIGRY